MRRKTPPVALAAALLGGGLMAAGAVWPAQHAQDQQPQVTVYKSPT